MPWILEVHLNYYTARRKLTELQKKRWEDRVFQWKPHDHLIQVHHTVRRFQTSNQIISTEFQGFSMGPNCSRALNPSDHVLTQVAKANKPAGLLHKTEVWSKQHLFRTNVRPVSKYCFKPVPTLGRATAWQSKTFNVHLPSSWLASTPISITWHARIYRRLTLCGFTAQTHIRGFSQVFTGDSFVAAPRVRNPFA